MTPQVELTLKILGLAIGAYLFGGFHFASILAKLRGVDITTQGSGNPGTMNMLRTFGVRAAVCTLILDGLKGAIPALIGYFLLKDNAIIGQVAEDAPVWMGYYVQGGSKLGMFIGGFCVIVGHIFPVYSRFRGGKGAASCLGVFFVANPIMGLIGFLAAFIYLYFSKYGSVASFIYISITSITEIVLASVYKDNFASIIMILVIVALILFAHRSNIKRLIQGTESDINIRRQIQKKKEGKLL